MNFSKKTLFILAIFLSLDIGLSIAQQKEQVDNTRLIHLKTKFINKTITGIENEENEDEDADIFYNWEKCVACHSFSEKELSGQIKQARKRHRQAKKTNNPCSECHDQEEVLGICCHATYPK